jgi:hypothetical protein
MPNQEVDFLSIPRPRPDDDPMLSRIYDEFDLGQNPTLGELKDHVIYLMRERREIIKAMGLVLGRTIFAREVHSDDTLRNACILANDAPETSFDILARRVASEIEE